MLSSLLIWHFLFLLPGLVKPQADDQPNDPIVCDGGGALPAAGDRSWGGVSPSNYPGGWQDLCPGISTQSPNLGCYCPSQGAQAICPPNLQSPVRLFRIRCIDNCNCGEVPQQSNNDSFGLPIKSSQFINPYTGNVTTGYGIDVHPEPQMKSPFNTTAYPITEECQNQDQTCSIQDNAQNNTVQNGAVQNDSTLNGGATAPGTTSGSVCASTHCQTNNDCGSGGDGNCVCRQIGEQYDPLANPEDPVSIISIISCASPLRKKTKRDEGPCECSSAYHSQSCCPVYLSLAGRHDLIGTEKWLNMDCPCSEFDILPECCERLPCSCNNGTFAEPCCDTPMINLEL